MNKDSSQTHDVVIMGAGIAGLCQARHLMLKLPELRIALVDPKGTDPATRDFKVGESLVEISAMFLYKDLELQEYLIENHCPKYGLNFHWPKEIAKTDSLDDYFHIWTNGNPDLPSYQINRAKFEADLLQMCIEMGVEFIQGKVTDFEIGPGSEPSRVMVRSVGAESELTADHLIDAAGRKFFIGNKVDNIVRDPEELAGLNTGSAWLRVDGIDRDLFQKRRDSLNGSASHYYGTNHFFGHGHWVWMIPIETNRRTVSFGVVHHKHIISGTDINSRDKMMSFLKENHRIVYDLIESGEVLDFKYLPTVAHTCKKMISEDQWYAIGEAANMFDPFYSAGLVLLAYNVECVTEVIRAKMAGESDAEELRASCDKFMLNTSLAYNMIYQDHARHLGDAEAMSWRNYMESVFWFGILVPAFAGKWHLEKDFSKHFDKFLHRFIVGKDAFISVFYQELTRSQERGVNIGMMNYTRTDQLAFGYHPVKIWDDFMKNSKWERRQVNVLKGIKHSFFFLFMLFIKLRVKNSGLLGLLEPRTIRQLGSLTGWFVVSAIGETMYKWDMRKQPCHPKFVMQKKELMSYQFEPKLMPWRQEPAEAAKEQVSNPSSDTEMEKKEHSMA